MLAGVDDVARDLLRGLDEDRRDRAVRGGGGARCVCCQVGRPGHRRLRPVQHGRGGAGRGRCVPEARSATVATGRRLLASGSSDLRHRRADLLDRSQPHRGGPWIAQDLIFRRLLRSAGENTRGGA